MINGTIAPLRKSLVEEFVGIANASAYAVRWGKGVKIIAVGWLVLLFSAWLHGEITTGFAYGAITSGVYWTVGAFLEISQT